MTGSVLSIVVFHNMLVTAHHPVLIKSSICFEIMAILLKKKKKLHLATTLFGFGHMLSRIVFFVLM